jgi:hypothetical protein
MAKRLDEIVDISRQPSCGQPAALLRYLGRFLNEYSQVTPYAFNEASCLTHRVIQHVRKPRELSENTTLRVIRKIQNEVLFSDNRKNGNNTIEELKQILQPKRKEKCNEES